MTTLEAQHEVITNLILENEKLKRECDEAREALRGILRIVESFRYSTALGKSQLERFETANRLLESAK